LFVEAGLLFVGLRLLVEAGTCRLRHDAEPGGA
jgi:hypothetical protein